MAKKIVKKTATKKTTTKKVAKPAKKIVKKTAPKKTVKKTATKRKPNPAFMKPLTPSATLANVIGATALPRTEAVKKMWTYIKKHGLQGKVNKREINADEKLMPLFGKNTVTMFDLAKILSKHLS